MARLHRRRRAGYGPVWVVGNRVLRSKWASVLWFAAPLLVAGPDALAVSLVVAGFLGVSVAYVIGRRHSYTRGGIFVGGSTGRPLGVARAVPVSDGDHGAGVESG